MSNTVTFDGYLLGAIVTIASIHLAGRMAARRGRSFRAWALVTGLLTGPLSLPLLWLLPDLTTRDLAR